MRPNHVHLHVRDLEASQQFYQSWFDLAEGPRYGPDLLFLNSADGFDLALSRDPDPGDLPDWFHWGFKLADAAAVRSVFERMRAAGVPIARELVDDDDLVMFRCLDPDGFAVELYWE